MSSAGRVRGAPPGRAGKIWLEHRLAVAERGVDLLEQKLRILRFEHQRLALLQRRTAAAWERASAEAERWSTRAALLGGRRSLRLAASPAPGTLTVSWASSMGVRYPSGATYTAPEADPESEVPVSAAILVARDRHEQALAAAVAHAAATAALRTVEVEQRATRRRVRAIKDRWVPRLRRAQRELGLALEELEHSEAVRLRWTESRSGTTERLGLRRKP